MVVGREERARADVLVDVLDDGPRQGEAVEGAGAAADLVQHDERAPRRVVEDVGDLDHLDHEGRGSPRPMSSAGSDASEDAVDDADAWPPTGRDEGADLRQEHDQRESGGRRSTCRPCWVRSEATPSDAGRGSMVRVVRDEGPRSVWRLLDDRVAAGDDLGSGPRPRVDRRCDSSGWSAAVWASPCEDVELARAPAAVARTSADLGAATASRSSHEGLSYSMSRAFSSAVRTLVLELLELGRDEPLGVLEGLLADPGARGRGRPGPAGPRGSSRRRTLNPILRPEQAALARSPPAWKRAIQAFASPAI